MLSELLFLRMVVVRCWNDLNEWLGRVLFLRPSTRENWREWPDVSWALLHATVFGASFGVKIARFV